MFQLKWNVVKMDNSFHITEKRELAIKPEFYFDCIWNYSIKFNDYYNDNFGFRIPLISYNNYVKVCWFDLASNSKVTFGKEDWMYYTVPKVIDNHQGKGYFTELEMSRIKTELVQRKDSLTANGVQYFVVIAPDKISVYPEYLPDDFMVSDSSELDQFIGVMKNTDVEIIDLRKVFFKHKHNQQLYFKSDSHWNQHAGFIAYQEIMNTIQEIYPSVISYAVTDFNIDIRDRIGGDIAELIGIKDFIYEENPFYEYGPNTPCFDKLKPKEYEFNTNVWKPTYVFEAENTKLPRLLVFNDSYVDYIHHFFAPSFSRSAFFWMYEFRRDLIQKENPDIVIQMMVERSLDKIIVE